MAAILINGQCCRDPTCYPSRMVEGDQREPAMSPQRRNGFACIGVPAPEDVHDTELLIYSAILCSGSAIQPATASS